MMLSALVLFALLPGLFALLLVSSALGGRPLLPPLLHEMAVLSLVGMVFGAFAYATFNADLPSPDGAVPEPDREPAPKAVPLPWPEGTPIPLPDLAPQPQRLERVHPSRTNLPLI